MVKTQSSLRDTKNILNGLWNADLVEKENVLLVTADVASLYAIIQHDDASLTLNLALGQRDDLAYKQYFSDTHLTFVYPKTISGTETIICNEEELLWVRNSHPVLRIYSWQVIFKDKRVELIF